MKLAKSLLIYTTLITIALLIYSIYMGSVAHDMWFRYNFVDPVWQGWWVTNNGNLPSMISRIAWTLSQLFRVLFGTNNPEMTYATWIFAGYFLILGTWIGTKIRS